METQTLPKFFKATALSELAYKELNSYELVERGKYLPCQVTENPADDSAVILPRGLNMDKAYLILEPVTPSLKIPKFIKVIGVKAPMFLGLDKIVDYITKLIPFEAECFDDSLIKLPNGWSVNLEYLEFEAIEKLTVVEAPKLNDVLYANEQAGAGLNPLERFIQQNQPTINVQAQQWREELKAALKFAVMQNLKF